VGKARAKKGKVNTTNMPLPFRYFAAIVVAFMASILSIFPLESLLGHLNPGIDPNYWFYLWPFGIGIAGVSAGSLCLPRNHRWFGSLFLLFLGLGFTVRIFYNATNGYDVLSDGIFLYVPLSIGGLVPVTLHYLLRPKSDSKLNGKETSDIVASADKPN
jgi:hypothetical protein